MATARRPAEPAASAWRQEMDPARLESTGEGDAGAEDAGSKALQL